MDSLVERVVLAAPRAVVLTAAAGYGKSTFVRAYGGTFGRLAICDCEGVRDTEELARRALDALTDGEAQARLDLARSRLARGSEPGASREILDEFWRRDADRALFAFENADALRGIAGAHELVEALVTGAPPSRTLAFCARRPLPAAFGRAIGTAGVVHLDAEDLQLAAERIAALAAEHGVPDATVREIVRLSAGWPVVARLLIDLAASGRFSALTERLDDVAFEELYAYLADVVLGALPADVADAVVVAAAVPNASAEDVRRAGGMPFDAVSERRFRALPFVTAEPGGTYVVHPLVRAMVAALFPERVARALETTAAAHERSGNAARAARIALVLGDAVRAARALDAVPSFMHGPGALADCESIVARLEPERIATFPNLWIATIPFRRFAVELRTYLGEARRVYYCLPPGGDARLRTDALLHLSSALYQSALFEESETVLREALETFARAPSDERATLLAFVAMLRGLQGRFNEARALRAEAAGIRSPDFLGDLGLHYIDAHEAIARGRYEPGMAVIEESLRRMREAKLPLYVAFTATNGAVFAWANGDDARFAAYLAEAESVMVPGIERGFRSVLAGARGAPFAADERFESPVALAMAHLYRMGFAGDAEEAASAAHEAARAADRCRDPYLQVLAHAACALLPFPREGAERAGGRRDGEMTAMLEAARRIEAPELLSAAEALARGELACGMLEPFVRRRVLRERGRVRRGAAVGVFTGTVRAGGNEVRLAGKELELLLYLALARARVPLSRAQIAEAVWPEIDDEEAAANNLRVTLSRLRRKLGDEGMIVRDDSGYRLSPDAVVDARELDLLVRGTAEVPLADERRDALRRLFENAASGTPARFDRFPWFAPHRLRLREQTIAAGTLLARDALARGLTADALRHARALVDLDPLDDDARRLVLEACAAAGEWGAARRELDGYAAMLRQELDAEPSPELGAIVDAARAPRLARRKPA